MLKFLRQSGIQLSEFVGNLSEYDTARKIFERQIRYWNCRPMPPNPRAVVCPADSRGLIGSMEESSGLYLKQKFFSFPELLGDGSPWQRSFAGGDYAVFRLTPEKYHYTHSPVSGRVLDIYSVEGRYYPCNPNAAVQLMTPVSKNRRVVTILDTDCPNGSVAGRVAMIEVVALMIGQIEQRYSEHRYENPRAVEKGMFLRAGAPKALFRPGSSTVVLLFQRDRVRFARDLVENQQRCGVHNRFSLTLGEPVTETDVAVRSLLATPVRGGTMLNLGFVAALALGLFALVVWGVRTLPAERWQMLAAVPIAKSADGSWRGLNLTFYGFFSATGTAFGFAIMLLLLASVGNSGDRQHRAGVAGAVGLRARRRG